MSTDKVRGTPGQWEHACDSYGKVQHSRKACVYANIKGNGSGVGDRLVTIAGRIENWDDARIIATAPDGVLLARKVLSVVTSPEIRELAMRIVEAVDGEKQG